MSYAEHGPRIFLAGRPGNGVHSIYGDYVAPQKRSEGRLKMYDSCTDLRAWSPNALESTRYFRELNEHATTVPGKVVPFDVVMENMIGLTAQAQKELRVAQRELQKYKSLKLSPEQWRQLEGFDKAERDVRAEDEEETRIGPVIRPLLSRETLLFHPSRLACLRHPDTYLSMYLHPDRRFRYDGEICNSLLANIRVSRENRFTSSSENETYLVSRVTSCDLLSERKPTRECSNQASVCIEYVDASSQAVQTVCEMCVQTDEYKDADVRVGGYDEGRRDDLDSCSSQYYGSSESASTSECKLRASTDLGICEKSHRRVIIQKDSEIIVLKNELGMKEDELEELRELNRRLEERSEDAKILKRNFNILQRKLQTVSDKRKSEVDELSAKLSASECLVDQLKAELGRRCQVCHSQSQEIQQLREQVKDAELLSMENESLARKVKEIECLSKEAESYGITLEQMRSVWQERAMLQEQCQEQIRTLADQEDEVQQLLTLIKQMSVETESREVEMNDVVSDLRNEIRARDDKISRCEMQLSCMEREVGNLTSMLKSSLNNFDESKVAYESICEQARCEHDTCLDVQSASAALGTFIAALEESKRERHDRLQEIDNLRACVACYSQETVSEIANTDFYTGRETIQQRIAEDVSMSSNRDDCRSSKELVNVQIQSDEVETSTTCSDSSRLNQVISNEEIDRALTTHIKRYINKMSAILQGAGDHHVQIVREHVKQQQELQKKDLEITELKQKVAEHTLRRGEGDCMMQEQLRKRMLEKEVLETAIGERDSEITRLRECLGTLEERVCAYREERDTLKNENADLADARSTLAKENEARREELRAQSDQMRERIQEIGDLKLIIDALQKEAKDIDDLRKKLMDLQMRNNDLTNKLVQTNETIRKHTEIIANLKSQDEKNRLALERGSVEYDAMITQKLDDIARLRDENRSLRDQLNDAEIKLAHSNDTISLLRRESDSLAAISVLRTSLTSLEQDKEKLLARADSLRNEIANCEDSTTRIANELLTLSRQNEALRADVETVRSTNDQLLRARENDAAKQPLKDALCTLPGRIYEKIVRLREDDGKERDNDADGSVKAAERQSSEIISGTDDRRKERSANENEEFDMSRRTRDELDSVAHGTSDNFEQAAHKLRLFETEHEERLRQIKKLMSDVQLRDFEIKNLQECVTFLLREKNELQNKVHRQVEEYQSKLALLKRKYDSSLSAFRKRHNENVERLQAQFQDIMKIERSPFDAESWLQSLNLKELAELNNRIDILSSRAAANGESDIAEAPTHHARRNNNSAERKPHNKFTLRKERPRENKIASLNGGANKRESTSKICDAVSSGKVAFKELYSRDSKHKRRLLDNAEKKPRSSHAEPPESKTDKSLDWQREKFIYRCSVHHKLSNGR